MPASEPVSAILPVASPSAPSAAAQPQQQALKSTASVQIGLTQAQDGPALGSAPAGLSDAATPKQSQPSSSPAAQIGLAQFTASLNQHSTPANDPNIMNGEQAAAASNMQQHTEPDANDINAPCSICLGVLQSVDGQIGSAASNTLLKKFSKDDNSAGTWNPLSQCTVDAVAQAIR